MRPPAAGLQINLHIAGYGRVAADLEHGAAKVRSAFHADEAGMKNAQRLAIGSLEPIAMEALVLPDGLQQFFRRRGITFAQHIYGSAAFAPRGVKIRSRPFHRPSICLVTAMKSSGQI
jgi:hypothetical protein